MKVDYPECDACGDAEGEVYVCECCCQAKCESCYGDIGFEWCEECRHKEGTGTAAGAKGKEGGR